MTHPEIARALEHLGRSSRDLQITDMYCGSANRAVRLLVAGDDVVLRLAGSRTADLVDRSRECDHMRLASSLGVAPEVLAADPDQGLILYRFADGQPLDAMDRPFATPVLQRLGRGFRTLRQAIGFTGVMNPWEKLETYLDEAGCTSPEAPDAFGAGWAVVDALRHACRPEDATPVASHVDPVPPNIIDNGDSVTFLDWEYAALCHPLWDPAYFASEAGLEKEECRSLLAATGMEGGMRILEDWIRLALAVSLAWCLLRRERAVGETSWNSEIAWRRRRLVAS
ncbi:MAG: phosphotransferase family protein [bacterium]|nr:phosphotransferase family protein [bacterium]